MAEEYKPHKAEFDIAHALIKARLPARMTQAQIARMESGHHMLSLQSIANTRMPSINSSKLKSDLNLTPGCI